MKYNCLIVDDEPVAQDILARYVEQLPWLNLVFKCKNALEASEWLKKEKIDLIFLDIEMPHLDGISFLNSLERPPKIIVTTAYRDYAIEGFELNVADYLLKPISFERFLKAVNRVAGVDNSSSQSDQTYVYLKVDQKMVQVNFDEIQYIQGLSNYVRIFCESRTLISYQKLSYLEEVLPKASFIRSHKSYIVNLKKIKSYTSQDVEIGKMEIPIGAKHKADLMAALNKHEA